MTPNTLPHTKRYIVLRVCALICLLIGLLAPVVAQSSATGRSRGSTAYLLTIRANVPNAVVYIDGRNFGKATYQGKHNAGVYEIKVTAPGYRTYTSKLNLNKNIDLDIDLKPDAPLVTVIIPSSLLDPENRRAPSLISVYLDGKEISSRRFTTSPGKHDIAVRSGGLYLEKTFLFQQGQEYEIRLDMDFD